MKRDENGSIVVEASLSFVIFVLVLVALISLLNIMWVYMRVQTAMTSVVSELSSYTYIYSVVGLQSKHDEFKAKADETKKNVDEIFTNLDMLVGGSGEIYEGNLGNLGGTIGAGGELVDGIEAMVTDPKATLQGFLAWGLDKALEDGKTLLVLEPLAASMIGKYIEVDASNIGGSVMSADDFLEGFGVVNGLEGLNFDQSKLMANDDHDVIDLVVTYEIKLPMSPIPLKVKMLQRATTYAWLDGDGTHYEDE